METIRNYLNTMFANMPDTEETRRAKSELLSMMEDKYNELIASGMPKNEVIGTIITEFGSLDEIAQAMDLNKNEIVDTAYVEYQEALPAGKRVITINEASDFVMDHAFSRFLLGMGVFFCIVSPAGPIIGAAFGNLFGWSALGKLFDGLGVAFLFLSVALGVGLIILSSAKNKEWKFLKKGKCILDRETEEFIRNEKITNSTSKSMMLALGIILCIVSVVPVSLFGTIAISNFLSAGLGPSLIFVLTGAGVFLILNASRKVDACERLLALNK
jgi:hypothetical protein